VIRIFFPPASPGDPPAFRTHHAGRRHDNLGAVSVNGQHRRLGPAGGLHLTIETVVRTPDTRRPLPWLATQASGPVGVQGESLPRARTHCRVVGGGGIARVRPRFGSGRLPFRGIQARCRAT
jgi:hypothetical protein